MELDTIYNSWFTQKFLVCKYFGRIDNIKTKIVDDCHTEFSMFVVMESTKKTVPVKFTLANTSLCRTKEDLNTSFRINFDSEHPPISGKTLITEKGGHAILNFDTGIKNRLNSELITNGIESSYINIPLCKGTPFQEYYMNGIILIFFIICISVIGLYFKKSHHKK